VGGRFPGSGGFGPTPGRLRPGGARFGAGFLGRAPAPSRPKPGGLQTRWATPRLVGGGQKGGEGGGGGGGGAAFFTTQSGWGGGTADQMSERGRICGAGYHENPGPAPSDLLGGQRPATRSLIRSIGPKGPPAAGGSITCQKGAASARKGGGWAAGGSGPSRLVGGLPFSAANSFDRLGGARGGGGSGFHGPGFRKRRGNADAFAAPTAVPAGPVNGLGRPPRVFFYFGVPGAVEAKGEFRGRGARARSFGNPGGPRVRRSSGAITAGGGTAPPTRERRLFWLLILGSPCSGTGGSHPHPQRRRGGGAAHPELGGGSGTPGGGRPGRSRVGGREPQFRCSTRDQTPRRGD